jgi:rod shape-determining protein MreD
MMTPLLFVGGFLLAALVQLYLPCWPIFGGIKPPVLLSLVLYHALKGSPKTTIWAVAFAVLLQDGLDLNRFGPALLGFPTVALLAHRIQSRIFVDLLLTQMIFGALSAFVAMSVAIVVYTLTGQRPFSFSQNMLRLIGSLVLGMGTFPALMWFSNCVTTVRINKRRRRWL